MAMTETGNQNGNWKKFLKNHLGVFILFAVAAVLAAAGAVYVFLWFVGNAQSTGLVPSTLGLWTMGNLVTFLLYAIFWELLLIGIPVAAGALLGWVWWKRLPEEVRKGHGRGRRSRSADGGGAVSLLFFIAFAIKVYIDGNWNVAMATWTIDYVVYSALWILIWALIIFGIPAAIIGIVWLARRSTKQT
jgi:hypothetical protein